MLKSAAQASDVVLAAPHAAVATDLAGGTLHALAVSGLPPLASSMGIVSLRGRTPSPMADLVIRRLPSIETAAPRRAGSGRKKASP